MFKKKTVFVVGAGGSFEVGLPVGDTLAVLISDRLKTPEHERSMKPADERITDAINGLARSRSEQRAGHYHKAAQAIAQAMPISLSIDNFLHTHSEDQDKIDVGKIAIARCILEAERTCDLYTDSHKPFDFTSLHARYRLNGRLASWHNTFFKMLTENVKRVNLKSIFDNICIITFNYDRCIEHYMSHAFARFFEMPLNEAQELCTSLEIIHPYGQVGNLLDRSKPVIEFGMDAYSDELLAVSKQIRTFTEQMTEESTVEKIRSRMEEATSIVFLGFSYGDMNIRMLQTDGNREYKTVVGSAKGISESNRQYIDSELRMALRLEARHNLPIHLDDATCYSILNNYSRLIMS